MGQHSTATLQVYIQYAVKASKNVTRSCSSSYDAQAGGVRGTILSGGGQERATLTHTCTGAVFTVLLWFVLHLSCYSMLFFVRASEYHISNWVAHLLCRLQQSNCRCRNAYQRVEQMNCNVATETLSYGQNQKGMRYMNLHTVLDVLLSFLVVSLH